MLGDFLTLVDDDERCFSAVFKLCIAEREESSADWSVGRSGSVDDGAAPKAVLRQIGFGGKMVNV